MEHLFVSLAPLKLSSLVQKTCVWRHCAPRQFERRPYCPLYRLKVKDSLTTSWIDLNWLRHLSSKGEIQFQPPVYHYPIDRCLFFPIANACIHFRIRMLHLHTVSYLSKPPKYTGRPVATYKCNYSWNDPSVKECFAWNLLILQRWIFIKMNRKNWKHAGENPWNPTIVISMKISIAKEFLHY